MRSSDFNAFADDDEDRIAGLDVVFRSYGARPPAWVLATWASEALGNSPEIVALLAD